MISFRVLISIIIVLISGFIIFKYLTKYFYYTYQYKLPSTEKEYQIPISLCIIYNSSTRDISPLVEPLQQFGTLITPISTSTVQGMSSVDILTNILSPCDILFVLDTPPKGTHTYIELRTALEAYGEKHIVLFSSTVDPELLKYFKLCKNASLLYIYNYTILNSPNCFFCLHVPLIFNHTYTLPQTILNCTPHEYSTVIMELYNGTIKLPFLIQRGNFLFINNDITHPEYWKVHYGITILTDLLYCAYYNLR